MKFYLADTSKYMTIEMRTWEREQWTPDFFGDMETNVPLEWPREDGGDAYICTSKDFRDLVDFWEEECRRMREGEIGELTFGEEYRKSDTCLFVGGAMA